MENVNYLAVVNTTVSDLDVLIALSDRRQIKVVPTTLRVEQLSCYVVVVQSLHDHDDGIVLFAIEPGVERVEVPLL